MLFKAHAREKMNNPNTLSKRYPAMFQVERCIKEYFLKITVDQKAAFCSAFFCGLVVHIVPLTNLLWFTDTKIGNEDPAALVGWLITQGKWLIEPIVALEGAGSAYHTNFKIFIGLVILAASSALVVEMFQIRGVLFSAITGALMASFPSVMVILAYDMPVYFWIGFFAFLCVFIHYRYPSITGGIVGTILLVLTLGMYPPYITIVASGYILLLLQETVFTQKKVKDIFLRSVRLFMQLLVGICGYYIVLQVALRAQDRRLSAYMNVDEMVHIDFFELPMHIMQAYKEVWRFFVYDANGSGVAKNYYRLLVVILLVSLVFIVFKKAIYRDPVRFLLTVTFGLLFPLAVNLSSVVSKGTATQWHMRYAFVMLPILCVKVVGDSLTLMKQDADEKNISLAKYIFSVIQQWGAVILFFLLVYRWATTSGEGYLRMRISYEKDYALLTNVVDDIYESDALDPSKEIFFSYAYHGTAQNITNELLPQLNGYDGISGGNFMIQYSGAFERYVSALLGIDFQYADAESKEAILKTEEYAQMPCYPYTGYIQEINDILVVKINDETA